MPAKLAYPLAMLQRGEWHDPFGVLGRQAVGDTEIVRAFMPSAEAVELDGIGPLQRIPNTDILELSLDGAQLSRQTECEMFDIDRPLTTGAIT